MSEEFEKTQMIEIREPEKKPGKKKKLSKAGVILFSLLLSRTEPIRTTRSSSGYSLRSSCWIS